MQPFFLWIRQELPQCQTFSRMTDCCLLDQRWDHLKGVFSYQWRWKTWPRENEVTRSIPVSSIWSIPCTWIIIKSPTRARTKAPCGCTISSSLIPLLLRTLCELVGPTYIPSWRGSERVTSSHSGSSLRHYNIKVWRSTRKDDYLSGKKKWYVAYDTLPKRYFLKNKVVLDWKELWEVPG